MGVELPVLMSVRCLMKYCLPEGELPHIVHCVNDFLDDFSVDWTIVDAYKRTETVRFMQYVAAREDPKEMDVFYRRWLFNAATELTAAHGDFESLQWLMENYLPDEFLTKAVSAAATSGHLNILQWLFENHNDRGYWGYTEMCGALANGHTKVVEWLQEHAVPRTECMVEVMNAAASAGYLTVVKWLHEEHDVSMHISILKALDSQQWEISQWILEHRELVMPWISWDLPARGGALGFLKFLYSYSIGRPGYFTLQGAAWNGHLDVVKWLHSKLGLPLIPDAMRKAAQNGHLHVVEWLHENGCEGCDAKSMITAADHGHLNVVEWLHEHGVQLTDTAAIDCAARSDHLAIVKWLLDAQHHKQWCAGVLLDDAATNGRLNIVQYLHEKLNADSTTSAMDGAARGGHIHVIQWLHSNTSAGSTTSAMDWASRNGHLDVVKWLHANRTEGCTAWAMEWAVLGGHLDVVQWLHDNRSEGCFDKAMDNAAKNGHLHIVKWLHANRKEGCTAGAMNEAAANGHLQVVRWLQKNRSEGSTSVAMARALMRAHFDVVLFLHSHRSEDFSFLGSTFVRHLSKELLQWLLDNYADKVDGCEFEVPNSDWRFNDWCAKVKLRRARGDGAATWWVCESTSLQLQNM